MKGEYKNIMSNVRGVRKNNPRVLTPDVYTYCANATSLTQDQVKECFEAYGRMIDALINSDTRDSSITVVLPLIGKFSFKVVKGRKAGSTYLKPNVKNFGDNPNLTPTLVEEDQPDYERLVFKPNRGLQKQLRAVTSKRWLTRKNSIYYKAKKEE